MGKTRGLINNYTELRVAKMISRRNKKRRITWKLFKNRGIYDKYKLYKMKNLDRIFA